MSVSVLYQNVRGLRTKTNTIFKNSFCCDSEIICLTETWVDGSILNSELFCDKYAVYRRDRGSSACEKVKGGGCLIAVSTSLNSFIREEWFSEAEDLWVTVLPNNGNNSKFHLCCVYIPPADTFALNSFCSKIHDIAINNPTEHLIICGDFNLSVIQWTLDPIKKFCIPSNVSDTSGSLLLDTMSFGGFCQYNNFLNSAKNTLDLIFDNQYPINNLVISNSPLVKEDQFHNTLEFQIIFTTHEKKRYDLNFGNNLYNFQKGNYIGINNYLQSIDWNTVLLEKNVNDSINSFYKLIQCSIDNFIPKISPSKKRFPHWFRYDTIRAVKEKNKWHTRWKKYRNSIDYLTFKLLRGRCKFLIEQDYKHYLEGCESEIISNPKHLWQFAKSKRNNITSLTSVKHNETHITDGLKICELFSEHFSSFLNGSACKTPTDISTKKDVQVSQNIAKYYIPETLITEKIGSLKNKAAGPDGLPTVFIKKCQMSLSKPLHLLFNRSLSEGIFPKKWKTAFVVPIHKSGDKTIINNYRPISKLCILAKLFESIIYDYFFWDVSNLIIPEQHGFMRGRSVETNLVDYTEYLSNSLNKRVQVDVIYTDFSKAFDRVDHKILLARLSEYGVTGSLLKWFDSYLSDRSQAVSVGRYVSSLKHVSSGVPQGSHLGPLLFNLYINNIYKCFRHCKFLLYADDLKIFRSVYNSSDCTLIQEDLEQFQYFCEQNSLVLNLDKCHTMSFSRNFNVTITDYKLCGRKLQKLSDVKDLGVIFDNKLIFDKHIANISNRANKMLGFIIRTCYEFKNVQSIRMLYMAYVNSILNFASVIWNPHYLKYINKLESTQKHFVNFVNRKYFSNRQNNSSVIKHELSLFSLEDRRKLTDIKFIYKLVNNKIDSINLKFMIMYNVPSYTTRTEHFFSLKHVSTNYCMNSPLLRCSKTYNSFSNCVSVDICSDSLNVLINKIKKCIFNK